MQQLVGEAEPPEEELRPAADPGLQVGDPVIEGTCLSVDEPLVLSGKQTAVLLVTGDLVAVFRKTEPPSHFDVAPVTDPACRVGCRGSAVGRVRFTPPRLGKQVLRCEERPPSRGALGQDRSGQRRLERSTRTEQRIEAIGR